MSEAPGVAILGAGPAGIATACCLRAHGIEARILDRGQAPAAGLRRIDPEMEILSPLRLSRIPGMEPRSGDPTYLRFPDYVQKLDEVCARHGIEVTTGAEVVRVRAGASGFIVHMADGSELTARHVVNATGIVSHPRLPPGFEPDEARYRWLHSIDFRTHELSNCRKLLVVGGGQSAAELIERWLLQRRPRDRAWLSLRSGLVAFPRRVLGVDIHYIVWPFEFLDARWLGMDPTRFRDPMLELTTRRAIRSGAVVRLPEIRDFRGDGVVTVAGERLTPDLIVFATGFEYALDHLEGLVELDARGWPQVRACESRKTPGLYLLGLRYCRSLASAYLRGIARDARAVAARIATHSGATRTPRGRATAASHGLH